jgi:hypothetical protein
MPIQTSKDLYAEPPKKAKDQCENWPKGLKGRVVAKGGI